MVTLSASTQFNLPTSKLTWKELSLFQTILQDMEVWLEKLLLEPKVLLTSMPSTLKETFNIGLFQLRLKILI